MVQKSSKCWLQVHWPQSACSWYTLNPSIFRNCTNLSPACGCQNKERRLKRSKITMKFNQQLKPIGNRGLIWTHSRCLTTLFGLTDGKAFDFFSRPRVTANAALSSRLRPSAFFPPNFAISPWTSNWCGHDINTLSWRCFILAKCTWLRSWQWQCH